MKAVVEADTSQTTHKLATSFDVTILLYISII